MPKKPTKPLIGAEVIPTPTRQPCQCGEIMSCDECWSEMCRTEGYASPTDGLPYLVPVQIHVDLPDPVHDELEAVARASGMRVQDVAHDIIMEWAGRRMVGREPR